MNLILKLALGIIAGIVFGAFAPDALIRIGLTFQGAFGQFINFVVPFLIFCFIAEGIANLNYQAGKMLGATTGLAYLSTLGAGFMAAAVGLWLVPELELPPIVEKANAIAALKPFASIELQPIFSVTTALVSAFLWGLGVAKTQAVHLRQLLGESKNIIEKVVERVIIPVLPYYIAALFMEMTAAGEVVRTLETFGMVLCIAIVLHVSWLIILYSIAGAVTGIGVLTALKTMLPAYFTAVGTMSSVATIPVTLQQTIKNGVHEDVADFVIPLCATIHLAGSTITLTVASIAVMLLTMNTVPTWDVLIPFIAMLGVTMVAAPGVPGGAVMAALGLFSSMLGFNEAALGLMITLYIAQDSFGTACNVTGDGAIALMMNRILGKKLIPENRFHTHATVVDVSSKEHGKRAYANGTKHPKD